MGMTFDQARAERIAQLERLTAEPIEDVIARLNIKP